MDGFEQREGFIVVKGAEEHNLKLIDVDIPRNAFVVFTGISGSGKSSLAFGTIFAEAQRRFLESMSPYARRLINQVGAPKVKSITGLPPAIALQQGRGASSSRSNLGTVTQLSNTLRMLFSRAGTYPHGTEQRLDSDAFSPNTPEGACPTCRGLGEVLDTNETLLVPDPKLSIAEKAIAAWPGAWQGKNLRDILDALGYDIHAPWKDLPQSARDWILFTDDQPVVTVHPIRDAGRIQRDYQGTYMSARRYVLHTYFDSKSDTQRKKVTPFLKSTICPSCGGTKLNKQALAVHFDGENITYYTHLSLEDLDKRLNKIVQTTSVLATKALDEPGITQVAVLLAKELLTRIGVLKRLGLAYLSMDRSTTTLSSGELQRLKLATQLRSGLFGVAYVLDEPSAGLHPSDVDALLSTLIQLKAGGNSLLIVEHNQSLVRQADWIVDIGPQAGEQGGYLVYNGPYDGLRNAKDSITAQYLFSQQKNIREIPRRTTDWFSLSGIERNNLHRFSVRFPLYCFTVVTGVSGSGKSTLVAQVLPELVGKYLAGETLPPQVETEGLHAVDRLIIVDQKPIGRTPKSNLATYTGLFDFVRQLFSRTAEAKNRGYKSGHFSFNRPEGYCPACQGEGYIHVELLFLPETYAPCPVCHGQRYNPEVLEIYYEGKNIAEVLDMTVSEGLSFFSDQSVPSRMLQFLSDIGLGYLQLGQPATSLSGGEAQRIKLATELQRAVKGSTLYILDEPTTGLHPADIEKLFIQLQRLVDLKNTVIVVEHDMWVASNADYMIDLGPGGGEKGGHIVASGIPAVVAANPASVSGKYLFQGSFGNPGQ